MKYSFSAFSLPHQNTQFEETRIHHKTHTHTASTIKQNEMNQLQPLNIYIVAN